MAEPAAASQRAPAPTSRAGRNDGLLVVGVATVALGIGCIFVMGVWFELTQSSRLARFDLDRERGFAAAWSALLLGAGALVSAYAWWRRALGWQALVFTALLGVLALDESWGRLHEQILRHTSIPWQAFYAPLGIVALAAVVTVWRGARDTSVVARRALAAGFAAWVASQAIEYLQWPKYGPQVTSSALMVAEETLEMTGSALILFALVRIVLDARTRAADGEGGENDFPARWVTW